MQFANGRDKNPLALCFYGHFMRMRLIEGPNLPQSVDLGVDTSYALHNGQYFYLLPGITRKISSPVLECFPIQNIPDSTRERLSKPPFFLYTWYDLSLTEKKQAIALLLFTFEQDVVRVASILGHQVEYVEQLNENKLTEADEAALLSKTKIDDRIIFDGMVQNIQDYYHIPSKHHADFLNHFEVRFLSNPELISSRHPFVSQTLKMLDKDALGFLLRLQVSELFTLNQRADMLIRLENKGELWEDGENIPSFLRQICTEFLPSWRELSFAEVVSLLFPKGRLFEPAQVCARVDHGLKRYLTDTGQSIDRLTWSDVLGTLSFYGIVRLSPALLEAFVLYHLKGQKRRMSLHEQNACDRAIKKWIEEVQIRIFPEMTEETLIQMAVSVALIDVHLASAYWPDAFLSWIGKYESAITTVFEQAFQMGTLLVDRDLSEQIKITDSLALKLFSMLTPYAQCQIKYSARFDVFIANALKMGRRDFYSQLQNVLETLFALNLPEDVKAQLTQTPLMQFVKCVSRRLQCEQNNQLLLLEEEMLHVLLKGKETELQRFEHLPFIKKILNDIMQQLILDKQAVIQRQAPDIAGIPMTSEGPEYREWARETARRFKQDTENYSFLAELDVSLDYFDDLKVINNSLDQIQNHLSDIQAEFKQAIPHLLNGNDPLYVRNTFLLHFNNAVIAKPRKEASFEVLKTILTQSEWRILSLYVIARAWYEQKNDPEKLRMLFKSFHGYCFESRTRGLFDNPPSWSDYQTTQLTDSRYNREEIETQIRQQVDRLNEYCFKLTGVGIIKDQAICWMELWFQDATYKDAGITRKVDAEYIAIIIDSMEHLAKNQTEQKINALSKYGFKYGAPNQNGAQPVWVRDFPRK